MRLTVLQMRDHTLSMIKKITIGLFSVIGMGATNFAAAASSVCAPLEGQTPQYANCERLVQLKKIPNARAFGYTIKYRAQNKGALKDPSCAINEMDARERFRWKNEDNVKKGIENDCTFILNDINKKWHGNAHQSTAYFVDLCASDSSKLTTEFYINVGTGPIGDDSPDKPGDPDDKRNWNKSTLAGAFLIQGKFRDEWPHFTPTRPNMMSDILTRPHGIVPAGRIPAIDLIGLNSSNNTTESLKPLHVTAPSYKSSFGCLGVNESSFPILERAVAHGNSLVMNYAGSQYEEKGTGCTNDTGVKPYNPSKSNPRHKYRRHKKSAERNGGAR